MRSNAWKHGQEGSRVYDIWVNMKQRCLNPKVNVYSSYGGRGIKICEAWLEFETFYKSMGDPPEDYTIERINPNGDYEPKNCRWIPKALQARNTRRAIYATLNGKRKLLIEWCEEMSLKYSVVHQRITRDGLTPEHALMKPITRSRKGIVHKSRLGKAIRDDQIERNGTAELEEGRVDE